MKHDDMIAVIAAHRDGKQIEWRQINSEDKFALCDAPIWEFYTCEYRIKPVPPRRFRICLTDNTVLDRLDYPHKCPNCVDVIEVFPSQQPNPHENIQNTKASPH